MVRLNLNLSLKVLNLYNQCFEKDTSKPARFDPTGKFYMAPFEVYKPDYKPLEEFDISLVDPNEIGYRLGRHGNCSDFLLSMLDSGKLDWDILNRILKSPEVKQPSDGDIVVYHRVDFGVPVPPPLHFGFYIGHGRVISKFSDGPICKGGLHTQPFNSYEGDYRIFSKDVITFRHPYGYFYN